MVLLCFYFVDFVVAVSSQDWKVPCSLCFAPMDSPLHRRIRMVLNTTLIVLDGLIVRLTSCITQLNGWYGFEPVRESLQSGVEDLLVIREQVAEMLFEVADCDGLVL